MSRISRPSLTTTTPAITKTTSIVLVVPAAQDQKELRSLSSQVIVLVKQGNLSMSFVKPTRSSIPDSQRWRDTAVEVAETLDTDMAVVEAAVEVPNPFILF